VKIGVDYKVTTNHIVQAVCPDCYGNAFRVQTYQGQQFFKCLNPKCGATGVWSLDTLQKFAQSQSLESLRKVTDQDNVIYHD
jgi:hypothetical protein